MLDNETKRRIDTARDILVGKVPDPKSQVEQITIALIYKFMDDMDSEAEELGGESSFFSGEYEKYGWRKIFNPGMGGFEMLSLYSEAILKMAQNPNLPQLFRDIFKNAYLPYRDPETLKSFLKIIDDFSYDHSEKLGDAFEYLLSILGSQGDAGQFRTPRHIIDFMTAIVDPRKSDTILDPACGTAGFLISAFKHILKANSSNYNFATDKHAFEQHGVKLDELTINGKKYRGDKLTPDERARIINSIRGYDISPDMVRLSLVNLYLHGFTDPHIFEYDTLTSEDRWNEYVDVILANPPFMSPKGGIRPHKRFSIQSNRSEVLFVDYMVEHLTPTGRAAIIVPEGVIFQSGTAYKSLRKMLVEENYLVGIISLPAGLFNPYSGVKTSILWIDKSLARKTDKILFAKITADGFDLGAQRRPVKQNDLPDAFRAIKQYIDFLQTGSIPTVGTMHVDDFHVDDFARSLHATIPPDAASVGMLHATSINKTSINAGSSQSDAAPVNPTSMNAKSSQSDAATVGTLHATSNNTGSLSTGTLHATSLQIAPSTESALQSIYPNISLVSKSDIAENGDYNLGGGRYKIQLDSKSRFEIVSLFELVEFQGGYAFKSEELLTNQGTNGLPVIKIGNVDKSGKLSLDSVQFFPYDSSLNRFLIRNRDILVAMTGATVGKIAISEHENLLLNQRVGLIRILKDKIHEGYLGILLLSEKFYRYCQQTAGGGAQGNISPKDILSFQIPLPPLSVQQKIVAEIEAYQKIIDGARQVVENYKPRITIDPDWEMVELGKIIDDLETGVSVNSENRPINSGEKGVLKTSSVTYGIFKPEENKIILPEELQKAKCSPKPDSILISRMNTENLVGASAYVDNNYENLYLPDRLWQTIVSRSDVSVRFLHLIISSEEYRRKISEICGGTSGSMKNISKKNFLSLYIPLPPLETQNQIVAQIEREQALVNANKELIRLFEQKVKDRIARVWGEDMPKAYPEPAGEFSQVAEPNG